MIDDFDKTRNLLRRVVESKIHKLIKELIDKGVVSCPKDEYRIGWKNDNEEINAMLSFDRLRKFNVQRCEQVFHPVNSWSPADWAVAMAGEAGEVCNAIKKLKRLETNTNTAKDPQTEEECIKSIANEMADTIIYIDLLAARLGIDLGKAVIDKFNVVSDRMGSNVKL